jgi:elongation factor P
MEAIQVRKGMVIVDGGNLFAVVDRDLNTPGNWRAILHLKVKNLKTGSVTTLRPRPSDKIEIAFLDKRRMQYLYQEGSGYVFMDKETFDQVTLDREWAGDQMLFLRENDETEIVMYEGKPISLELPGQVELRVTATAPWMKGATVAAQYKPATMETGLEVQVPGFIDVGETIQIETSTGKYLGRAK